MTAQPSVCSGQDRAPALVTVSVVREDSTPVVAAELRLSSASLRFDAAAASDEHGQHVFRLSLPDTARLTLSVRKPGYQAFSEDVLVLPGTPSVLTARLTQVITSLGGVNVTADTNRYQLSAAEIAASSRTIENANDAITKLSPDMLGDRGRNCQKVKNVWINNERAWSAAPPTVERTAGSPVVVMRSNSPSLKEVLESVHAAHIASIRYANCWQRNGSKAGTSDAIYITLKPGIGWSLDAGSFAKDSNPGIGGPAT